MTEAAIPTTRVSPMARARAILGGSAGNLIEWYDWFAYASFSLYFAKVFFPGGDQTARLLQTAAVFAVGFFARPVGAWAFGLYADRSGRKAALTTSVAMMCFGSLMVAVVPGYATIGAAAPIILTLARLIQGFSIGGEYGASATYLSEMAGKERRGFWSSFQFLTLIGGQITALGVLIVLQHTLTAAQLSAWGWRIPFVIGAALAIVVFFIQTRLSETASFEAVKGEVDASSIRRLLREHPAEVGIIFVLSGSGALGFYCFTTYMQKFLTNTGHFSKPEASTISAASLVAYLFMMPLFGWLGDRFGRRNLLIFAFGAGAVVVWPILVAISHTTSPWIALGLICAFLVTLSGYSAVNAVVKAELFPAKIRGLGVSLPYAVANAIFGGTAEYVALALKKAGHEAAFYIYVAIVLAAGAAVALRMRDTQALSLIEGD
jgi:MHS family alpha-ketoglutarate permease-like MFS transporter